MDHQWSVQTLGGKVLQFAIAAVLAAQTFDYYVSPTGADTNLGTVASPWAITSLGGYSNPGGGQNPSAQATANWNLTVGKRVGLLPGNYDVSALMAVGSSQEMSGALQIKGGTGSTAISYWGSSDASGHYLPRTATIDIMGASNYYGGNRTATPSNSNGAGIAHGYSGYGNVGWITIDGLVFKGWSFKALRVGGQSSADGVNISNPCLITNCEFYGGGFNQAGMIQTWTLAGGSGYTNGFYFNTPLTGGTGKYATANITVSGGAVTSVVIMNAGGDAAAGANYTVNDVLSASIPGGSGFTMTVLTIGSAGATDNCTAVWLDGSNNAITFTNNYLHDSVGHAHASTDHFNGVTVWGGGAPNSGVKVTYNTLVHAGNIFGKERGIQGTIITNNYQDTSDLTAVGIGIQDFTGCGSTSDSGGATAPTLTLTTVVANNIVIMYAGGAGTWDCLGGVSTDNQNTYGWNTPVQVRNNTVVNKSATAGAIVLELQANPSTNAVGGMQAWNNIYHNPGGGTNGFSGSGNNGNFCANPAGVLLLDYNMYPSTNMTFGLATNTVAFTQTKGTSASAWYTSLGSGGTHDVVGAPTFTSSGSLSQQYQLTSGSTGHLAGRIDGTTGTAITDMGAWGGNDYNTGSAVTQIGCNFGP